MRWNILNCEPSGYSQVARGLLQSAADIDEFELSRSELLRALPAYDGLLVRLGHRIDEELLSVGKRLKFVATPTTGLNHVDLCAANSRGVSILSLRGEREFLTRVNGTAEHTWALLLGLVRRMVPASLHVRQRGWNREKFRGSELAGRRLGILGYGRLGSKVARLGNAFGMEVQVTDISGCAPPDGIRSVSLDELLSTSDVLSLHVSYTAGAAPVLGVREIGMIRPGTFLVNTSRGEVLDEASVVFCLKSGVLAGVAVDVISGEADGLDDWMSRSPLLRYMMECPDANVIVTPHIGGATHESMAKTEVFIAGRIVDFVSTHS